MVTYIVKCRFSQDNEIEFATFRRFLDAFDYCKSYGFGFVSFTGQQYNLYIDQKLGVRQ